jgi:hypothetical protein
VEVKKKNEKTGGGKRRKEGIISKRSVCEGSNM